MSRVGFLTASMARMRMAFAINEVTSRAFFSGLHCVTSPFRVFGIAAGSPPSLRDGACSARIDPHTVFGLAPCAISLKNALNGEGRTGAARSHRIWVFNHELSAIEIIFIIVLRAVRMLIARRINQ